MGAASKRARPRDFDVIVAMDLSRGIGKDGDLPWNLPSEMRHFVATTTDAPAGARNAIIMGRVNWDSIPLKYRPLRDRLNIVLTRNAELEFPAGVFKASSLDQALAGARGAHRVFVIGGAKVYAQALERPECRTVYLTRIQARYDCDTYFPQFEHNFRLDRELFTGEDRGTSYVVEAWVRDRA